MKISKDTKKLLVFSFMFTTYLILGALIFQALETNNEIEQKLLAAKMRRFWQEKYNISDDDWEKLEIIVKGRFNVNLTVWSFGNAFIFAGSVMTTVGYGNIVPRTTSGRAFCICYALLGVPLTCLTLKAIGEKLLDVITSIMKKVKAQITRAGVETIRKESVLLLNVLLWVFTLVSLSWLAAWRRGWSWLESFYFCFITFSTIGFGDYVAFDENEVNSPSDYFVVFLGVVLGFAVTSTMLFSLTSLMNDSLEDKTRKERFFSRLKRYKSWLYWNRRTVIVKALSSDRDHSALTKLHTKRSFLKDNGVSMENARRASL